MAQSGAAADRDPLVCVWHLARGARAAPPGGRVTRWLRAGSPPLRQPTAEPAALRLGPCLPSCSPHAAGCLGTTMRGQTASITVTDADELVIRWLLSPGS